VRSETVTFFSEGTPVTGTLRLPDHPEVPMPGIVQGPGWLGLRDAALYEPYHEALTHAGFAVLIFDYRGFGDSGGDRGTLSPRMQLEDLVNAVTWLGARPDVDAGRIGVFGSGGTGGGNAVLLAAHDDRVRCAVSQVPVADGADWLRRMRASESDWDAFLDRLAADRERRVGTGQGEMVHPREEIMIPSAERRKANVKKDVDGRIPTLVRLAAADEILAYRPVDAAVRAPALCVIAVDGDVVTPTDHAEALYAAAPAPKQLIMQYDTTHYAAYRQHGPEVIPRIVSWFTRHIGGPVGGEETIVEVRE
jgi:dipeptidyl aminopeptidase/acylaminoacyl peptidase